MTDGQLLAALSAAPFLTLMLAWLIGLACLAPKAVPVRVKRVRK